MTRSEARGRLDEINRRYAENDTLQRLAEESKDHFTHDLFTQVPDPAVHPEREKLLAAFYGLYLRYLGFSPQYAARETQARYPRVHVPKALLDRIETL